ncbi:BON domain-containing protein [Paraburkholderia flagellata]|uniref:BON domain-containing protein n=1 Tax=Paraburkholderia flagellata TaxID=2883241 RepID=UPI001F34E8D3|nr:BON domain-containing protein [Paraburkholderia flagellata]
MRTTHRVAVWAIAALLSTAAVAQGTASSAAAGSGAAGPGEASQPTLSKKAERAANRQFAKKIHQALNKTKGLGGTDIAVFANSQTGDVILGGFVDNQAQEQIATEAAGKVTGVKSVTNKMTLRPQL